MQATESDFSGLPTFSWMALLNLISILTIARQIGLWVSRRIWQEWQ